MLHSLLHAASELVLGRSHESLMDAIVRRVFDPTWNRTYSGWLWTFIVAALFLSGVGFPLPEDVPLTLSGFTTARALEDQFILWHYVVTFITVSTPILLGDMLAYGMGRRWGFGLRDRFHLLRRLLSDKRMYRVQGWFDEYGTLTVLIGRQVAGVRFVTFFTAGTMRMPLSKFVFFDFLGCLVSIPIWLTLGALTSHFGREWLRVASKRASHGFILGGVLLFVLLFLWVRRRRHPKPLPIDPPVTP